MNEEHAYRKLKVYEKATNLVVRVYALLRTIPKEEQYALSDQLRRAVVSIASNIAEGMGRISQKDRAHFLEIAYGSLMETNCQLEIAKKLGYINETELQEIDNECVEIARMLSGLRVSLLNSGKPREESGEDKSALDSKLLTLD